LRRSANHVATYNRLHGALPASGFFIHYSKLPPPGGACVPPLNYIITLKKDFLPRKDSDFPSWTTNFLKYLFSILMRILFPNEMYQEPVTLRDDFAQKLETAEEPATRTKLTVQAKKAIGAKSRALSFRSG
jgi:hypothetical protein